MSILCNNAAGTITSASGLGNFPAVTSAWQWFLWAKVASYALQFTQVNSWPGAGEFYGADTGEVVNNTTLDGYTGSTSSSILTGSDTSWVFIAGHYSGAGSTYPIRYRKQGTATLSSFNMNNGSQMTTLGTFHLFGSAFSDPVNTYLRSFCFQNAVLSDADLLTVSQSLGLPAIGTNLTFLALNDATNSTTIGDNLGTGVDWTVVTTGMSTQSGVEPDPTIPGLSPPPRSGGEWVRRNALLRM